jgi:hypothetical protein
MKDIVHDALTKMLQRINLPEDAHVNSPRSDVDAACCATTSISISAPVVIAPSTPASVLAPPVVPGTPQAAPALPSGHMSQDVHGLLPIPQCKSSVK